MKLKITNDELFELNDSVKYGFPKYTSQIINLANQNAQGTRPRFVGQLSELFPQYLKETNEISIESWERWYTNKYPESISVATDKIYSQIKNLKDAIKTIDKDMIEAWVRDLVIYKTYNGMYFQEAIFKKLEKIKGQSYRKAEPDEESKGIDGFIGDIAYQIKPNTYKAVNARSISDSVKVTMVYYSKTKAGLDVEIEE